MKKTAVFLALLMLILGANAQQKTRDAHPFQPNFTSLKAYRIPEWFRDAKFGIWSHWGPQAVPRQGDWYARNMYRQGSYQYKYHLANYGHPSKVGYKNIIPLWKAEKWDPKQLMQLYKQAGAKYFVSMATHHDNFFLWKSKLHRWNAVNMGPKKDVVGIWQKAAQKAGLRFGVSEHLGASYTWFQTSHGADTSGMYKGIAYDGAIDSLQDLHHPKAVNDWGWLTNNVVNQKHWLACMKELIDNYHPDLLYSDSRFPFDSIGKQMLAHYYNSNAALNRQRVDAVYNCKQPSNGMWVEDLERGVMDSICPFPWQTDTSIGDWFYKEGQQYKSAKEVVQMLVDIVSKNGNLLINVVQTPEGNIEPDMLQILQDIGKWTAINGEGIYASRPWKIFGENPSNSKAVKTGNFNESSIQYSGKHIRYTTRNGHLYAYIMGMPTSDIYIKTLGLASSVAQPIASITLLGSKEKVKWQQQSDALMIQKPTSLPTENVLGYKIVFTNKTTSPYQ